MSDNVNKPSHYNAGEVETIDGIRAALGEGFADYCRGNVLKYVWRCGLKGDAVEDLKKASKYLEWAIEAMESNCPEAPDSSDRKPLAIPDGWRELEPDEVPLATDMHEWMGGWFFRNDDATHEYCWYSNRHIRKIETANPSEAPNSSTPTQWMPKIGEFVVRPCGRPAKVISIDSMGGHLIYGCEGTNSRFTLGTLKPWVPKVGDKVRVVGNHPKLCGDRAVVYEVDNCSLVARVVSNDGRREGWLPFRDLELIEAAK